MTNIVIYSATGPRENMEDAAMAFAIPHCTQVSAGAHVLLISDGVGGQAHGEAASGKGLHWLGTRLLSALSAWSGKSNRLDSSPNKWEIRFRMELEVVNRAICYQADKDPELNGMAATVVGNLIIGNIMITAWSGDSRCYLSNHNGLQRVTRDHSKVQLLIDQGEIDPADAAWHPDAHVITRFLGQASGFVPETTVSSLRAGDVVLDCTDGLTDVLSDNDIAELIADFRAGHFNLQQLAKKLVEEAIAAGTQDNTTVICYQHGAEFCDVNLNRTCTAAYASAAAKALSPIF